MGSGGAKKTNEMLGEETRRAQGLQDIAAQRSADIYGAGRGDIDWARGELKGLYSGLGADGGGGGGGGGVGFDPMEWESKAEPFYGGIMESATGIYTPEQLAAMESAGSDASTAAYEGIARDLASERAGRGLGYGAGTSGIMRDNAYNIGRMAVQNKADIADKIASSRMAGAEGLTPIESEKRAFKISERDKRRAAASANASRAAAAGEADLATKRSLINQILGLEGDKDLAYMDRQLAGMGRSQSSITSRVDETPMWQKLGADLLKGGAAAAAGAFTGGAAPSAMGALKKVGQAASKQGGLGALQYDQLAKNPFG